LGAPELCPPSLIGCDATNDDTSELFKVMYKAVGFYRRV